jgi:hypothetical protein
LLGPAIIEKGFPKVFSKLLSLLGQLGLILKYEFGKVLVDKLQHSLVHSL